ncbi:hypothetical protein [Pontibacter sp. G13]|uniref:hypothetical protein n=1 Tax=Pontibacter sp. G13 TaxID=3074898 RepID=UPI00288B50D3|nr:hypothetical protein [Pontibacter sp. G13]WNJ19128.1 hypothetical protein RJD25_01440 [Pontibacter sp. G13]
MNARLAILTLLLLPFLGTLDSKAQELTRYSIRPATQSLETEARDPDKSIIQAPDPSPADTARIAGGSDEVFLPEGKVAKWTKIREASLYGGGSLFSHVTSQAEEADPATPSGSLGINLITDRISTNLFFTYSGKKEVEVFDLETFGAILMLPASEGQSLTFSSAARLNQLLGLNAHFLVVDNNWKLDSTTLVDASPLLVKLGFYIRPFDFPENETSVLNLTFHVHFTHRSVLGDFGNENQVIGGRDVISRGYNGLDISGNVYLNSLHFFVQYSLNRKVDDVVIPGFTGQQISFGLNFSSEAITLFRE